jgi:hypothetical protein
MLYTGISNRGVRAITNKRRKRKPSNSVPPISILSPSYSKLQLQNVLDVLNRSEARVPRLRGKSNWEWQIVDVTETQQRLRCLIAAWDESDRNLLVLFKKHLNTERELHPRNNIDDRWGGSVERGRHQSLLNRTHLTKMLP